MANAEEIAAAMNRWSKEGIDLLGGNESHTLNELLDDYFDFRESPLPGKVTNELPQ
jgi:hypothetical protein